MTDINAGGNIHFRPNVYRGIGEEHGVKTHFHKTKEHPTLLTSRTRVKKWRTACRKDGSEVMDPANPGEPLMLPIMDEVFDRNSFVLVKAREWHQFIPEPELVPQYVLDFLAKVPGMEAEKAAFLHKITHEQYGGAICMYACRNEQGEVVSHAALGVPSALV